METKKLGLLDKSQPILLLVSVLLGLILYKLTPGLSQNLIPLVEIGIFLVILLIMLGTDTKGILNAFTIWKPITIALVINFVFTPAYSWFLGYIFLRNNPDIWVGLILYLITPCIGWYLVFTELAEGDVALGVALLAWNIFLQIALMPLYMWLLARRLIFINFTNIFYSIFGFLILPFIISRLIRWYLLSKKHSLGYLGRPIFTYLKTAILMIVIISMFASQGKVLFENPLIIARMIIPGIVFFFSIMIISIIVGYIFGLKYKEVALLVFTTTARNSEVSLAIAVTAFSSPLIPLTVVIGPSIELPVLIIILRILLWIKSKEYFK
jgi:ACR3 family arsenite transporter